MTQIIQGLGEIAPNYDAVFCDVWGVLHNGVEPFTEACEALMQFRLKGGRVIMVTNSPLTPKNVAKQFDAIGVPPTAWDAIVTGGYTLQKTVFSLPNQSYFFMGRDRDRDLFHDLPQGVRNNMVEASLDQADCVICAGLDYGNRDRPEDYELELRKAYSRRIPLYCANPDVIVDRGETRIYCAGALAGAYEAMGGETYYFGKPYPAIYQEAREILRELTAQDIPASHILFIGDGVETDLKGAMMEDLDALFIAGGLAAQETQVQNGQPDPEALAEYLGKTSVNPMFTQGFLRWG